MNVIVDFGMGNLRSVLTRIQKLGYQAVLSSEPDDVLRADRLILPGVGAFGAGMTNLKNLNLLPALNQRVIKDGIPILGICLGMQLMTEWGDEGEMEGLGWIGGKSIHFNTIDYPELRVPHMGWNTIVKRREQKLLNDIPDNSEFYFVHSYHVTCRNESDVLAVASYGYDFAAVIQRENIFGTQFHPEKSHQNGARLLTNFLEL